jgi:hypothetical protein
VTSVHAGKDNFEDMEPDARRLFEESDLSRDPNRLNVFLFVLDERGQVMHECHGVPGGARGGVGRSDWAAEISRARAKLNLPSEARGARPIRSLPDLANSRNDGVVPAGVRIFVRQDDPNNSHGNRLPVVEVVPMSAADWEVLAFPAARRQLKADDLKRWLVWFYPAAIRTADERNRFRHFRGTLHLEPAGSDPQFRYARLCGEVRLSKETEAQSSFEGAIEAVVAYRPDSPAVHSLRAVAQGVYLYRIRGTNPQRLRVAIESRPN